MQSEKKVIALGFFDGVHIGHGALLRRVAEAAREKGAVPCALTFDHAPKALVGGQPIPLINTPEDRAWLMEEKYGIKEVFVLPFNKEMMELPWDRFVKDILVGHFNAVHLVAGHDYHFGYKGEGDPPKLKELCAELGIGCDIIGRVELDGITVSSTHIRRLMTEGNMEGTLRFLGHPHVLSGEVVQGRHVGRTIGIPTANLIIPEGILTPAFGVYATKVMWQGHEHMAVTNVGVRPTFHDSENVTVEPWILDFDGDLYCRTIRVEFYKQLRSERKFESLDALREEIHRNAQQTRDYFGVKH